ncbi:MAG: IMPACT family protein [Fusobacteriaceae bacterium]
MKTLKKDIVIEFEEKKSKFIGYGKPIQSKKEAEEFIISIKKKHPNATHNCSVYKVLENGQEYFKADDDGEPSGTAGKPMGEVLGYMEAENLVIVATRYFGGIKLGAGGLVRNYAKTAKLVIAEAGLKEYISKKKYMLDFDYEKNNEIELVLKNLNVEIDECNYSERVTYVVKLSGEDLKKIETINGVLVIEL